VIASIAWALAVVDSDGCLHLEAKWFRGNLWDDSPEWRKICCYCRDVLERSKVAPAQQ